MTVVQIRDLYIEKKLSSREVAERIGISQWSVISIMRRNNIPRRTFSEANHILFSRKPLSYKKKARLTAREKSLYEAALMLYWAEGTKKGGCTVDFVNSDGKMVLLFLKALRRIYQVDEKRLRVFLYCYTNQNIDALKEYWSKLLEISKSQFIKPYVRKDFDPRKKDKMPNGLVHIRYSDKKLFEQIKAEIDIICSRLNKLGWQSGQMHGSVKSAAGRPT
ncbi:MAG: hypothetical protein UX88_C0030G0005 [Candidatus Woesebacteria bacterium GW2011_GWC2_47_16]|uniref:Uncharacterized protein n=4 Tax=Candidatus Woeseibacteriota TaxID=1752722 RepID=A0A0G1TTX2_9BACT|nr:MAG: hypothetical protein UX03_C0005G0003 [Candidatus Woesebacteria bacterium GW2011_GWE1_45_18]KKU25272.1 MAG: hypothetical protein UX34_C0001G0066 [Candidatus Woesebacteria bacterium GW2011_GWF1_46_13]KKU48825.1 MAG: hypothetical protein UX67_C0009G0010 [Candidatus Woesebacteria bacterium GW2011_GWF2_46_8]KKU63413.1 MAG: hypothetical protein UX88_C0030G0005 [Candidatus Woesebacteria bacterium GW2011_GWC2_47_16]